MEVLNSTNKLRTCSYPELAFAYAIKSWASHLSPEKSKHNISKESLKEILLFSLEEIITEFNQRLINEEWEKQTKLLNILEYVYKANINNISKDLREYIQEILDEFRGKNWEIIMYNWENDEIKRINDLLEIILLNLKINKNYTGYDIYVKDICDIIIKMKREKLIELILDLQLENKLDMRNALIARKNEEEILNIIYDLAKWIVEWREENTKIFVSLFCFDVCC